MQPTIKLYDTDSKLTTCEATVLSCDYEKERGAYAVILDRTVFFPEGGGQFADMGTITLAEQPCCRVTDVQITDDIITHYTTTPLPVGSIVLCTIDWKRRFDFMQQHSAEHILSGLVHRTYGYHNVGFHLGLTETTLDFDGPLTAEQISDIEYRANQAVWENIPIEITFPDAATLAQLDYRSKKELTGEIRIVTLPGYDVCACCAPHVSLTGEIGVIKVISFMAHRGGMRLTVLCGSRAIRDYQAKQTSVEQISSLLSAKQPEVADAVAKTKELQQALTFRINALQKMVLDAELKNLPSPETTDHVFLFQKDLDTKAIRDAVNLLVPLYKGYCGIFVGDPTAGYTYVLASNHKDCRLAAGALRGAFSAKGGGSERMIQGSVTGQEALIRAALVAL